MGLPIWEYLRRRACEALLAGVQDAFDFMERQDQPQAIHAAAQLLRRRVQDFEDVLRTGGRPDNSPVQPALPDHRPAALPQKTNNPSPANLRPAQPASQDAARRGPGRPRKEVHG